MPGSLRLIPNLDVWRPGDTAETVSRLGLSRSQNADRPTALLLFSRQTAGLFAEEALARATSARAPTCWPNPTAVGLKNKKVKAVIIATGSEVSAGGQGAGKTAGEGRSIARAHRLDALDHHVFDRQDPRLQEERAAQGHPAHRGRDGLSPPAGGNTACAAVVGIDTYGESAPADVLFKHFGFTAENLAATVEGGARAALRVGTRFFFSIQESFQRNGHQDSASTASAASGATCFRAAVQNFEARHRDRRRSTTCWSRTTWPTCCSTTRCTAASRAASTVDGNTLIVNGKKIRLTAGDATRRSSSGATVGADIVLESTGLFLDQGNRAAEAHRRRRQEGRLVGARPRTTRRCSSTGVNDKTYAGEAIISNASCTTNCLAPARQGAERQVGHQARPDDHGARHHRDPEDGRRPEQQGLARRPRHPREHHPVQHRRGQGGRRGDPRTQQEAHRHELPGADLRRLGGRPDRRTRQGSQLQGNLRRDEGAVRRRAEGRARLHRGQGRRHRLSRRVRAPRSSTPTPASRWTAPSSSS